MLHTYLSVVTYLSRQTLLVPPPTATYSYLSHQNTPNTTTHCYYNYYYHIKNAAEIYNYNPDLSSLRATCPNIIFLLW